MPIIDPLLEQLRMMTPYEILGVNLDKTDFDERLAELAMHHQEMIGGACSRIALVDAIAYEATITDIWNQTQAGALQVYLLCTCFDALAGQASYVSFSDWLKKTEQAGIIDTNLKKIASGSNPSSDWFKDSVDNLIQQYSDVYAIGKNFRKLFRDLPNVLVQELISSYEVTKRAESRGDWTKLSDEEKLGRIIDYLFDLRRNTFTHAAKIVPAVEPWGSGGRVVAVIPPDWKHQVVMTNVNDVRGEMTLLRIVAIGAMRQMMGYAADQTFLQLHWEIARTRKLLRDVYGELVNNERRSSIYLTDKAPNLLDSPMRGMWQFLNAAAKHLIKKPGLNLGWLGGHDEPFRETLAHYVGVTDHVNTLIRNYGIEGQNPKTPDEVKVAIYEAIRQDLRGDFQTMTIQLARPIAFMIQSTPQHYGEGNG